MLIVVVSCFLAVEIPLAVLTMLHIFDASLELGMLNYYVINVLILFTNFFISLSYPINFGIYCGMSRQFRETFQGLFMPSASSAAAAIARPSVSQAANVSGAGGIHLLPAGSSGPAGRNNHNDCSYSVVGGSGPNGISVKSMVTNETGV